MPEPAPDPLIERIVAELRRPAAPGAGFDARVMASVRAAPPSVLSTAWSWLTEPRSVAVTPLGGLAAAAMLALVLGAGFWVLGSGEGQGAAVVAPETRNPAPRTLSFVFVAPAARTVALAGDFNGWDPARTPLTREASGGIWTVDVPLAPGRYSYMFVVDGRRFVADPAAPRSVGDDFGAPTSVVTVSGGSL